MSDLFLREIDFYQARAWGGPIAMLEGDRLRGLVRAGAAQPVPLFDFVYHDVGPVRLDGNLKLAAELGDIFFLVAGRAVLWGGLPELNYELSALELFPGMSGPAWYETYSPSFWVRDDAPYTVDPARGQFLAELAEARTGFARDYLAYGRMQRPPRFLATVPQLSLSYRLYNHFARATDNSSGVETGQEYLETGTHASPAVIASAWTNGTGRVGLALLDIDAAPRVARIELDPSRHGAAFLNYSVTRIERDASQPLGDRHGVSALDVTLPARRPVLIELAPSACAGVPECVYRVYRSLDPASVVAPSNVLAIATGGRHLDATPGLLTDGRLWFYALDDGAGSAPVLRASSAGGVALSW